MLLEVVAVNGNHVKAAIISPHLQMGEIMQYDELIVANKVHEYICMYSLKYYFTTFSGNDPKMTLVLNSMQLHIEKSPVPSSTMVALSATSDPYLHSYPGANLLSIPKDEEVLVFQLIVPLPLQFPTWTGMVLNMP